MDFSYSKINFAKLSNLMPCISKLYLFQYVRDINSVVASYIMLSFNHLGNEQPVIFCTKKKKKSRDPTYHKTHSKWRPPVPFGPTDDVSITTTSKHSRHASQELLYREAMKMYQHFFVQNRKDSSRVVS